MQVIFPGNPGQPIRWLAAGILIGIVMANLGLLGSMLIVAVLVITAFCKGYRLTMTKNDASDDR